MIQISQLHIQERARHAFFEGKMSEEEMKSFLIESHITRIIAYPWTFPSVPPFFKELYKTDMLAIYELQ